MRKDRHYLDLPGNGTLEHLFQIAASSEIGIDSVDSPVPGCIKLFVAVGTGRQDGYEQMEYLSAIPQSFQY